MIFLSSGHNSKSKTIKQDPGAVANGHKEGDLTIEFKNLVLTELHILGVTKVVTDSEEESLGMYLKRIKPGNASVVIEYHFDAASPTATGTTALIEEDATTLDKAFAKELADSTAKVLGIRNRGVKSETESHRGRLALMREEGIICLLEIGFLTNLNDLQAYQTHKSALAKTHAEIIKRYDDLIK